MEVPLTRKRSTYRRARTQFHTTAFTRFRPTTSTGAPSPIVVPEPAASYVAPDTAGPSVPADKGKAPMPDLDIPAEFLAEDAQARKRLEEEQASEFSATAVSAAPRFTDSTVITTATMDSAITRRMEFFLDSDVEMPPGVSRVAAEP
nr:hypothetical protein [Tanacetum cinerariifolium]